MLLVGCHASGMDGPEALIFDSFFFFLPVVDSLEMASVSLSYSIIRFTSMACAVFFARFPVTPMSVD